MCYIMMLSRVAAACIVLHAGVRQKVHGRAATVSILQKLSQAAKVLALAPQLSARF